MTPEEAKEDHVLTATLQDQFTCLILSIRWLIEQEERRQDGEDEDRYTTMGEDL